MILKRLFILDFQQIFNSRLHRLLTKAAGTSVVTDTIYGARFKHIDELRRMNAKIKVEGRSAIISGPITVTRSKSKSK